MAYVPERGDIVWLTFGPQAGPEQAGRRPALVVSPQAYNTRVGLALFCPITSKSKGYPFEVRLPEDLTVSGVILSDQVRSLDWRACRAELVGKLPALAIVEMTQKLWALIGDESESS
ncbi:MAG TPA: endoribonuclease MazF [Rubrobacter sp.]|nr:endoribonuclease MazF [Rubrobacter sp.]